MTLGELADKLRELQEAEQYVADCLVALGHGGNAETMRNKRNAYYAARTILSEVRGEELPK